MATAIDIRCVHSAIGTDEAVARFRDQNSALAAPHSFTLRHSHFSYARVQIVTPRPRTRTGGRFYFFEWNKLAFRFGYDFVFHDQDVAFFQQHLRIPTRL